MLVSTTVDYWVGRRMEDDPVRRKRYLIASVTVNLGMLGFFTYFNFFIDNARIALQSLGTAVAPSTLEILLPTGISFYTFQALSYTIDIYRGEIRARRNPIDFALFVAFFPHLVAGPIMRAAVGALPRHFAAGFSKLGQRTAIARALAALACVAATSVPGDRDGHGGRTVRHDSGLEEPDLF